LNYIRIGIDRDLKTLKYSRKYEQRMSQVGIILRRTRSKNGWHWVLAITNPHVRKELEKYRFYVYELRMWLGDDPLRILFDIIKDFHGYKHKDILFDKKWRGW